MKLKIRKEMKRYASTAGLLLSIACAQGSGGGGENAGAPACVEPQQITTAFEQVAAKVELKEQKGKFQLLVKMTDMDLDYHELKDTLALEGTESEVKVKKISRDTALVEFPNTSPAKAVIERFIADRKIASLEEDQETFAFDTESNDAMAVDMTPSETLTAPAPANPTGREVIVAIIDTGVDYTHKDLAPFMWKNPGEVADNGQDDDGNGYIDDVNGWDFVNEDSKPMADDTRSYHGTHVAGIVKQAALLAGPNVNLKIMALKYLNSSAAGRTSNAIRAIDYAVSKGAVILNNSWGSFGFSSALSDAITRAQQKNVLFMAASGNGDANGNGVNIDANPFYPAAATHANVVSISASTIAGTLAGWANFGAKNVDLAAPGVSILSARNGNTYARLTGTSMATPYISGLAAMLWAKRPDLSASEIRNILFSGVNKGESFTGKVLTGGNINWSAATQIAGEYKHDPNNSGIPGITPNTACAVN